MDKSRDYQCTCGKLLCKGAIFDGEIQIKCKRCGKIQTIEEGGGTFAKKDNKVIDAEELWHHAWTYIKTVVDTVREPFLVLDKDLRVLSANRVFYSFYKVEPKDVEGKLIYKLGDGQWDIPKLKILLEDILPKNTFFEDFKVEHDFPKIGKRVMMLNARRIFTLDTNQKPIILLAMEDFTNQKRLEDQLKEYTKRLNQEVAKRTLDLEARVRELEEIIKSMIAGGLKDIKSKNKKSSK